MHTFNPLSVCISLTPLPQLSHKIFRTIQPQKFKKNPERKNPTNMNNNKIPELLNSLSNAAINQEKKNDCMDELKKKKKEPSLIPLIMHCNLLVNLVPNTSRICNAIPHSDLILDL